MPNSNANSIGQTLLLHSLHASYSFMVFDYGLGPEYITTKNTVEGCTKSLDELKLLMKNIKIYGQQ